MDDLISRHHVEIKLKELVNEMEEIFSYIREKNVDDSVCGLCEYDCDHGLDGYANECPGFEKDDCFKLKEKYRSEWISTKDLPSAQPERWIPWDSRRFPESSGTYIVTAYDGAKERVTFAKFQKRLKRWELTGARAYWRVLAWLPLPAPYEERREE